MTFHNLYIIIILSLCSLWSCQNDTVIQYSKNNDGLVVTDGEVKAVFTEDDEGYPLQVFYVKEEEGYKEIIRSFRPNIPDAFRNDTANDYARFYDTRITPKRYLITEQKANTRYDKKSSTIILEGDNNGLTVNQYINIIPYEKRIHYKVECELPDSNLDYLMSTFQVNMEAEPFFVHTPALKYDNEESGQNRFNMSPSQDQIIGDRCFHAPAIILQDKSFFVALVPCLEAINKYKLISPDARRESLIPRNRFGVPVEDDKYTMPAALDLNIKSGLSSKPILAYGYADAIIGHHMHFNRMNDTSMIRKVNQNKIIYEFDLFLDTEIKEHVDYPKISRFIWEEYGHEVFKNRPHLAMPFEEYRRIIDSITFRPSPYQEIDVPVPGYPNTGSWLQWEENGIPMGGYRSAINWWNDKLHNSAFWNNARDASGFWFWAKEHNDSIALDRARRIINWCLSAPRNEQGLFATLYNAEEKYWGLQFSDPVHGENRFFLEDSRSYNIATMSKTGAHLLDYYLRCEPDERIVNYLKPYGDWLISVIDERGSVPAYVSEEMVNSDILRYSAHPAASLWFLANLYRSTSEPAYLEGAKKIAVYLEQEVLPEAKWKDMEQYFSCGAKPLSFTRDRLQHQIARGNLCIIWASEGFASLADATGSERYVKDGLMAVEYLVFTQCSWDPHFIYTAFPFGGFSVDNADVTTFLDARQAETVKPLIWYAKKAGRQDLLERAVAAARSSIVLINHPLHKSNNIYRHTNIYPFGLGPENIDHEGYPQSAMRTHPSWGEGSGIYTGLAEAARALGGLYINTEKEIAVGVDGLRISKITFEEEQVIVDVESWLSEKYLKEPWVKPYHTNLVIDGDIKRIIFNDEKNDIDNRIVDLVVLPGKYVRIVKE
ncbi:MAG: hypothetical protein ISS19_07435 [Bacteroidales bacterium]|nr:hypothetical protein [Bacteroidales bacterium]